MKFVYRVGKSESLFSKLHLAKKSAMKMGLTGKVEIWGLAIDWRKNRLMNAPVLAAIRVNGEWHDMNEHYFDHRRKAAR